MAEKNIPKPKEPPLPAKKALRAAKGSQLQPWQAGLPTKGFLLKLPCADPSTRSSTGVRENYRLHNKPPGLQLDSQFKEARQLGLVGRQLFPYRIMEGLPVILPEGMPDNARWNQCPVELCGLFN